MTTFTANKEKMVTAMSGTRRGQRLLKYYASINYDISSPLSAKAEG
jgi:hypothetical protein